MEISNRKHLLSLVVFLALHTNPGRATSVHDATCGGAISRSPKPQSRKAAKSPGAGQDAKLRSMLLSIRSSDGVLGLG